MIKSTHTKNHRNVKNSFLEFSPYVNIISGDSTQGKSATLSSILLPITNKPSGYEYKPFNLKRGEKSLSTVNFDDCSITRERSQSTNKYILNNDEENAFEAMGVDVPPQLAELINIPDYLIHTQHGGYFLIDSKDTGGSVAKQINKICNLEIIDQVTKNINTTVTGINTDIKYTKKDIKEKKEQLEKLDYVDSFHSLVEEIDKLILSKGSIENDISFLSDKIIDIENAEKENGEIEKVLLFEDRIDEILELISSYDEIEDKNKEILELINSIEFLEDENKAIENSISFEKRIDRLLGSISDYEKLEKENNWLKEKINLISSLEDGIVVINKEIVSLDLEIEKIKDELGVCPLCDGEFK